MIISLATTTAGTGLTQKDEKNPMLQLANENPLGITIKEITKPEEIRITDDKPKPFNPFKSTTTTTTTTAATTTSTATTTTIAPTTTETAVSTTTSTESVSEEVTKSQSTESTSINSSNSFGTTESPKEVSTEDTNQMNNANEHESRDYMDDGVSVSYDSSSVAPPSTKESSNDGEVEPQVLLVSADSNSIGDDSGNKSVRQTTENGTLADLDQSSENIYLSSTTEIGTESSTPFSDISSTENGEEFDMAAAMSSTPKNLVVVRQGGKTESFHISGTDGLQRVEELDVLSSTTEDSVALQSEQTVFISTEVLDRKFSEEMLSSTTAGPEEFDNITVPSAIDSLLNLSDNSAENVTNGAISSVEVSTSESTSEIVPVSEEIFGTVYYPESSSPSTEGPIDTVYFSSSEDGSSTTTGIDMSSISSSSSSESAYSTTAAPVSVTEGRYSFEEEDNNTPAENPEYPPIPDDLSLHHKEIEEEEKRRLPSKVLAEEMASSTAGPCDACDTAKSAEASTTQGPPIDDVKMLHKMDVIEFRAPGEPHLIPEWERTTTQKASTVEENLTTIGPIDTTTVATINVINKTTIFENVVTKTNKSEPLTLETLPNDVSSEEKYGHKEPTTERPTTKGYASINDSEEGSASSAQTEFDSSTTAVGGASPKDDAESIKLNSGGGDDYTDVNESYSFEGRSYSNSFDNHWRHLLEENGWVF